MSIKKSFVKASLYRPRIVNFVIDANFLLVDLGWHIHMFKYEECFNLSKYENVNMKFKNNPQTK